MLALIEQHADALAAICRDRHVAVLDLFGSAATGAFDPAHSDLDFLVTFADLAPQAMADAYFGLLDDLESLFDRPVDLVCAKAMRNPYFIQAAEESRVRLYAA